MNQEDILKMARSRSIPSSPEYSVDADGVVYNRRGHRMSQKVNCYGYRRVSLWINGSTKTRSVHSIVAEVFLGDRPIGMHIRHLDGNKENNSPFNLAYGTPSENEADKSLHGTKANGKKNGMHTKAEMRPRGSSHGKSVLTEEDVLYIKEKLSSGRWGVGAELSRKFGVSENSISNIKLGITWSHV